MDQPALISEPQNEYELPLDGSISGEFQELRLFLNDHRQHLMTTCVEFDDFEQLIWAGTQSGHITSYYGPTCMKYTAFQAHHSEIREILTDAHGVLSLCNDEVRYTTKQGLKIFTSRADDMHSMHSMVRGQGVRDNYVLMGGENEAFFELDLSSGQVYRKSEELFNQTLVVMKELAPFLYCGHKTGEITLHDPESLSICHTLEAHTGSLSHFDVSGNLIATCGFSDRYDHYAIDPYLMVFDLRNLRALPALQLPLEPYFINFMPTYTLRCLVVSQMGEFVICQPDSLIVDPNIYQLNNQEAALMDCAVSETYQCFGFGDASGYVHIWADRVEDQIVFNHSTQETVFADEVTPTDAFDIDDWSIPLTSIPLPDTVETLLSDWPAHLLKRADRPTPPIDPDILKNMTIRQFVGYAPNPKKTLRNQVPYQFHTDLNDQKVYPESPMSREPGNSAIPKMYRKVEIKYSKYGIEDFKFQHYNQTPFSGLEIHIPNAYCNSMLQTFFFMDVMRISLCNHTCQREFCVACELGFLFNMLEISNGQTCQATNFLRVFRTLPEASALGLLISDNENKSKSMPQTIQNWNRFVLRQLHHVFKDQSEKDASKNIPEVFLEEKPKEESIFYTEAETEEIEEEKNSFSQNQSNFEKYSVIKQLFGMDVVSCRTCGRCGKEHERKSTLFTTDLIYPDKKDQELEGQKVYPFTKILQDSIIRKQNTQAWCDQCKKYQNSQQIRKIFSLPDALNINCEVEKGKDVAFWRKQNELCLPTNLPTKQPTSPPKTCRYGKFCNRQACKFLHIGRDDQTLTPPSDNQTEQGKALKPWIPSYIKVKHNTTTHEVQIENYYQDEDKDKEDDFSIYKLISVACHIFDPSFGSTLVAHIRIDKDYHIRKNYGDREHWYVFNDFAISPVTEVDALNFNFDWKIPCVMVYVRQDIEQRYNMKIEDKIDPKILFADKSLASKQSRFSRNFTPLNSTEILKSGDIVGVDAEFVTLNQEESEMRRDGTLSTLRPSQMSVARITVVRGWGPLQGVPFIDDYISTSEQVVDYLTKFSGIKPGDLDANLSSKHLTTLKTSYMKLKYLVDAKVIFIGHGLKKDFRVINLVVPRDQVIDTVELFRLDKQRYVSLKFLAWHFLNIKIQADTHDSAEDAYTAIKLYEKYLELLRAGEWVFEEELEILYDTGRQYNWQVPD